MSATVKKMSVVGLIALFLTSFAYMSDLVIIPTADVLYGYYLEQGVDISVLDFILSGSQLFAIIGALLSSLLMRQFSKKMIIVVLYALFTIATCSTILIVDPYYIAATRIVAGFCFGAIFPTGIALIIEVFRDDETKVERYIGFYNGTMAFIGSIMSIVAGILLGIGLNAGPIEGMRWAFGEYLISIPILIALIVAIPRTPAEKDVAFEDTKVDAATGETAKFPIPRTIALMISMAMLNLIFNTFAYNYAFYLPANFEFLNATTVAIVGAIQAFCGGIAGVLFVYILRRFKRFTITLAFGLEAVAFLLFGFGFTQFPLVIIGIICNGFAFGIGLAYYYSYAAAAYQPRFASLMSSLITVGMGLGIFLCTFATTFFTELLGLMSFDEIMGMPVIDHTGYMPYVALAAGAAMVLSLILAIKDTRKGLNLVDESASEEEN